ncbi:hypothetical protein GX586_02830, partial [bacterium]|nr:hypothetical protein [bacterium]
AYTIDETLSLSFAFANGVVGAHIHSWVGDAWRNEIVLSGEKRLYRLNLGAGLLTIDEKGAVRTFQQEHGRMYEFENAAFIKQVASGNWMTNPCDYADGLETLRLTHACDKAVTTGKKISL